MPQIGLLALSAVFTLIATSAPIVAEIMTNEQIAEKLIDKTMTSRYKGMKIQLQYNSDGTVKMKAFVLSAAGTWEFSGAGMCMEMSSGPKKGNTCVTFEHLQGNTYRNSEGLVLTVQ